MLSRMLALLIAVAVLSGQAFGQASDAALKDRVTQLLERLESKETEARDKAEAALLTIGPRALAFLPDAEGLAKASDDLKARLARVREKLSEAQAQDVGQSKVTLQGQGIRLSEALRALQQQTGNSITDLREMFGQDASNPGLDLDLKAVPFFEALDQVASKAGLSPNFYTGDGSVGLLTAQAMEGQAEPDPEYVRSDRVVYAGPFRIELRQYESALNYATKNRAGNARFEVAWEPRLRPMLLKLEAQKIKIVDDKGREVSTTVSEESGTVVLRPENPAAEINLNMTAPERDAASIASLKLTADVTAPAGNVLFRFPTLTATNAKQERDGIKITLESTEIDEAVWKVNVEVAYPEENEAFESYRQGLFNNRVWLQRADGSRFEQNGGFNQTGGTGNSISFQYLFVDAPGQPADYQLVYETPSKVATIPLEFEFKDIPLP